MGMFGDDRAQLIQQLTNERDYLRQKVSDLEKQLLAMTNASAYRLLHIEPGGDGSPGESTQSILETRNQPYRPELTLDEVKQNFNES